MISFKNNKSRSTAVKVFFYLMMGLNIISAYSNYLQYRLLDAAQNGASITPETAEWNDLRQRIIAVITIFLILGTIITFIMWFYRAYKNLHALGIQTLNHSAGWAIGAWFVPFLNLGRPYMIMREIWEETQEQGLEKNEKFMVSPSTIVGWWWGFWLANNIVSNISNRLSTRADSISQLITYTQFEIFSDVVNTVAMILTLIMIMRMEEYEKRLWDKVQSIPAAPPSMDPPLV
jgi:heme/copper-type cytochrome/quinol oxidase subunit 2